MSMAVKLVKRPYVDYEFGCGHMREREVADFTGDERPAYRVEARCHNCSWTGEARFRVGYTNSQRVRCPKCETLELVADGGFLGRDEQSPDQERARVQAAVKAAHEAWERTRKIERDAREKYLEPKRKQRRKGWWRP